LIFAYYIVFIIAKKITDANIRKNAVNLTLQTLIYREGYL